MKFTSFYTLSGLNFATVESFEDILKSVKPQQIIASDRVINFRKYHLEDDQIIVFSDKEIDYFMILKK